MVTQLPASELATEKEENIFIRDANTLSWENEPVVYEFTTDRALLHQYYQLREYMYRKMLRLKKFTGEEDVYDKLSHVLIARKGKLCIGGYRLTVREPDEDFLLPMEADGRGFNLRESLPNFRLDAVKHAEISGFAVMEGQNEREVMRHLCRIMCEKSIALGMEVVFSQSPQTLARNWRLIANKECNLRARILKDVHVPENDKYPEIDQWYLTAFEDPQNPVDIAEKEQVVEDTVLH